MTTSRLERVRELDAKLVAIAKSIRVLGSLSWPTETVDTFLDDYRAGRRKLPRVEPPPFTLHEEVMALEALRGELDKSDPLQSFLDDTAGSYLAAAIMLKEVGSPTFHELSRALYGAPRDPLPASTTTHTTAATQLLAVTDTLKDEGLVPTKLPTMTAEEAAELMRSRLRELFGDHEIEVVVDPHLASKAAAGATRVRLRGSTGFTANEIAQLVEHEAYVHTATAVNGRAQPVLTSLGLGSPRTTLTQEGLATVAELVTRTIDVGRLRRIALRIHAIDIAMEGADFVEVYEFFREAGQSEEESARSAMRVFRGGDVRGRHVFTKDVVYLQGLIGVHTFLRKAIASHEPQLIERLFAGRLTLTDVIALSEPFEQKLVAEPRFVPGWARDVASLSVYLAFAALANKIDLGAVELDAILPQTDF